LRAFFFCFLFFCSCSSFVDLAYFDPRYVLVFMPFFDKSLSLRPVAEMIFETDFKKQKNQLRMEQLVIKVGISL